MVIWLTGLSGSGKSTLAEGLRIRLHERGITPLMIDGDKLRLGLCNDLGFSLQDRSENIRRAGHIAIIAAQCGIPAVCSLISPLRKDRDSVRSMCLANKLTFFEVYVNTTLKTCEKRDTKGLYKKARAGLISQFTGINSDYEPPLNPELVSQTENQSIEESVDSLLNAIFKYNSLNCSGAHSPTSSKLGGGSKHHPAIVCIA
jgi:adenylylsulfate kinase